MALVSLHDREEIAGFLARDPLLNIYGIGDLDDRFWPYTVWYARRDEEGIRAIAMLYLHASLPVLIALDRRTDEMVPLLREIVPLLPRRVYAHTSPGAIDALRPDYRLDPHGSFLRMALADRDRPAAVDSSDAVPLTPADLADVEDLYRAAYPGNWFDPWMLETGCYFGIRRRGALACVAGVHVVSADRGVAALGNIATRPRDRGRGLATAASAALCLHLTRGMEIGHIGLNVKADNAPAVACYTRLGFRAVAAYEETLCEAL